MKLNSNFVLYLFFINRVDILIIRIVITIYDTFANNLLKKLLFLGVVSKATSISISRENLMQGNRISS